MPPPPPVRRTKPRLGELLVSMGYLTSDQLEGVAAHQRQWGMSFGRAAIARGLCTEAQIVSALSKQTGIRGIDLEKENQGPEVQGLLSVKAAQQHRAVCLRLEGHTLVVAMAAPAGLAEQDAIRTVTGKSRIEVVIASDNAIDRAIARFYGLAVAQMESIDTSHEMEFAESAGVGYQGSTASGFRSSGSSQNLPQVTSAAPAGYQGSSPSQSGYRGSSPSQAGTANPGAPGNPVKRPEIFDTLGLSNRAADMVARMARSNNLTHREVIARVIEQWAVTMSKAPPK
ncbi:MAG: hypothetical protein QM817_38490 [Archangium sp.]